MSHAIAVSPAVGSRLPGITWMAFALYIVYGGSIPFHFTSGRAAVLDKLSRVRLNPLISPDTGRRVSIPDVVQNVALFVPFGVLGVLALRPRRSALSSIVGVTGLAAVLSAAVETLQLFEIDRTTSVSDLCADVTGAFCGALAAVALIRSARVAVLQRRLRGLVDVPAFYPLLVAAIVLLAAAWEPFDFTLDVGTLVGKLRALHADPWQFGVVRDEGVEVVRYTIFGLAASLWLRQLGVRRAATLAAVGGASIAVGLEASQWIVASRMPGLEDAAVHAAGAVAGAALSRQWPWGRSPVFWCVVLWFATALGAALQLLSPFEAAASARTAFEMVSHGFELVLIYFPLGFAVSIAGGGRRSLWIAVAITLLIAAPLGYMPGSDVAVAVIGAAIGVWIAGAGSQSFSPAHDRR